MNFVLSTQVYAAATYSMSGFILGPELWHNKGNAGSIWFYALSNPGLSPHMDEDFRLHGSFWSSNIGWITFDHTDPEVPMSQIVCPTDVLSTEAPCPVNGYAWAKNIGWIHLGGNAEISSISSVFFNADTVRLQGFGYSSSVGWIPFEGIKVALNPGLQGKAYIMGNIAGTKTFDTKHNSISDSFDTVSFSTLLTTIRKRIIELSRGYDETNENLNYRIYNNTDYRVPNTGWESSEVRSYIVVGGDIFIDGVVLYNPEHPLSLIAIKSPQGIGGNIYIRDDLGGNLPDQVHASLIAEGAIISGTRNPITGMPNPYIDISLLNIPTNQLYVYGTVISRNTVGGAARATPICPMLFNNCTPEIARRYDFNYFRNFIPADTTYNLTHRAYTKTPYLDTHSLIIEYDSRILSDPPPGLDLYRINK